MTLKTAFFALALAFVPALASAMCADRHTTTSACAKGQVWDSAQQLCVDQTTS
jgi:hypothetical protein